MLDGRYVTTQAAVAAVFGVERSTVGAWVQKGMPGKQGRFDLVAIACWYRLDGPGAAPVDDPLLQVGDSPALERYRSARAKSAELDLALRKKELVDLEKLRLLLGRWHTVLRRTGERLGRRCGADAQAILDEALDELRSIVGQLDR